MAKKTITFRASGNGALMVNEKSCTITEKQMITYKNYEAQIIEGINLPKGKRDVYMELKKKIKAPFQLSTTSKSFIKNIWLANEKGYYKPIKSKFLDKGLYTEEGAITLISKVDGRYYKKNEERITKGNVSGECDINCTIEGRKVIQDTKSCWDAITFMGAEMDLYNEWQGRNYMDLYDADEFWLRHCLVDCPEHLVKKEKEKIFYEHYSNDMTNVEANELEIMLKPLLDQVERNLVYSNSKLYTPEERVKTTIIKRDDVKYQELLDRIPHALEFYKKITLNGNF